MDNMYIKWKLKSFWIHICCQKLWNFLKKLEFKIFLAQFFKEKEFWLQIFQKKKKCGQKWDENFEKLILRKFFYNKFYFLCQIWM